MKARITIQYIMDIDDELGNTQSALDENIKEFSYSYIEALDYVNYTITGELLAD